MILIFLKKFMYKCTHLKDLVKYLKNTSVPFVTLLFDRKTASKMVDFIYMYLTNFKEGKYSDSSLLCIYLLVGRRNMLTK